MPEGNLPSHAKEIFNAAEAAALKGTCKGDKGCAARVGWSAVKKKYKKVGDKWVPKSDAEMGMVEFSLTIVKAAFDKASGEMRWSAVASDTDWDSYEERMSLELFSDFVRRAETGEPPPKPFCSDGWCGGLPYPSVAHYSDLDGKAVPGETRKLYIDGNRLKASGIFYDTPIGRACFRSICDDLYNDENKSRQDKVRISIGFLDYAHAHGNSRFERKALMDRCPMCEQGAPEVTYLKGHLLHLALTRVPVNKRTDITPEVEVEKSMTTRKEDAASIVGEEIADELERESKMVGKSEAYVEKADDEVIEGKKEETVEAEAVEEVIEEVSEPKVDVPQVDDIRQELSQIKSTVEALAAVLLAKDGKKMEEEDDKDCTPEMKKEGKCGKKAEKKSHVLDPVLENLKAEFDHVMAVEGSDAERLQALQAPYAEIAEALRSAVTPQETLTETPEQDATLEDIKSMIQSAIQPLSDQVKLLATQLSARSSAETLTNSTPQRRSIPPLVIQKANPVAEKVDSFSAVAKRSVGLPL